MTATPAEEFPTSIPTPRGIATANEFRSAIQKLLIFDLSSLVIAVQSAFAVREVGVNVVQTMRTSKVLGPWTPRTLVISMSTVADGPEKKVSGRSFEVSSRRIASGTNSTMS